MIVMKKALPRRTFLRGVGATLALPLLDAMIPALTALADSVGSEFALGLFAERNQVVLEGLVLCHREDVDERLAQVRIDREFSPEPGRIWPGWWITRLP